MIIILGAAVALGVYIMGYFVGRKSARAEIYEMRSELGEDDDERRR